MAPTTILPDAWARRLGATSVYFERNVFQFFFFGFSSGLPYMLPFFTLSYWLADEGTDLGEIGLFSLVALPFAFKFVWAPLIDRLPFPVLTRTFGRRRGWLIAAQVSVATAILFMAFSNPGPGQLLVTAIAAVLVAFFSASQDILIDGYRVEILEDRQQGAGAAAYTIGYRVAMLVSGGGVLILAGLLESWEVAYGLMAALMGVGLVTTLLAVEPAAPDHTDAEDREAAAHAFLARRTRIPAPIQGLAAWFYVVVASPLLEFFQRYGFFAATILAFILFYKLGDTLASVMTGPFYLELGFSLEQIGAISKPIGLAATITGALIGGYLVNLRGIFVTLWVGGICQLLSNFVFVVLAWVGPDPWMLALAITIENLAGGLGTTAFIAYMSGLCNIAYTVTQFALLTSLMNVGRTILSAPTGFVAEAVSWPVFFSLTVVIALPGLFLLWLVTRHFAPGETPNTGKAGTSP